MTHDAIGGIPESLIQASRDYSNAALADQMDRLDERLSRIEGNTMGHITALETMSGNVALLTANMKWVVETVTGLMQVASTLPGVGQMMRKVTGQ